MTSTLSPVRFDAPLVNPSPNGLYAATAWTDETGPLRWLADGVEVRPHNYGGSASAGVWTDDWCETSPTGKKEGTRTDGLAPFDAVTVWGFDSCDPTQPSQAEVQANAQQNLRMTEQGFVETEFATRALADAGAAVSAADIIAAVSALELAFARTRTIGFIHASPIWAARASAQNLVIRSGNGLRTPLGHLWVFGGGYADVLGGTTPTLVGTSPTFGWRGPVAVRDAFDPNALGEYAAIAERSVVVGYEHAVAAVKVAL